MRKSLLLILSILLFCTGTVQGLQKKKDKYDTAYAKVKLPPEAEMKKYAKKNKQYKEVVKWLGGKKNWRYLFKQIDTRLGLFDENVEINVSLSEKASRQAGMGGGGPDGKGFLIIFLKPLSNVLRRKGGLNDQAVKYVVVHEAAHIYQGRKLTTASPYPFWFREGMCEYAAENIPNLLVQKRTLKLLDKQTDHRYAYGRGRLFFEYIEGGLGKGNVKKLITLLAKGRSYKEAVKEISGMDWEKFQKAEKKWSQTWLKKLKKKYPGITYGWK